MKRFLLTILFALTTCSSAWADTYCGVDDDLDGTVEVLCPGNDKDNDGFPSWRDCDDTNPKIFPDSAVATKSGCSSNEARTCQESNGIASWGSCSSGGWKPSDCTTAIYVDPTSGNDTTGNGTFANPYQTGTRFNSFYSGGEPSGYVTLSAGYCVVVRAGTWTTQHTYNTGHFGIIISGRNGSSSNPITIVAYPDETVTFDMSNVDSAQVPIAVRNSSYVKLVGFSVTDSYCAYGGVMGDQACVGFPGSTSSEAFNLTLWDNTGSGADNLSALYTHSGSLIRFHHNKIYDNFLDISCGGLCAQMLWYRGTGTFIDHNLVMFSAARTDRINGKNKHSDFTSWHRVGHNVFINGGIDLGGPNYWWHHNRHDDAGLYGADPGGTAFQHNWLVERNTFRNSVFAKMIPQRGYNQVGSGPPNECTGDSPIHDLRFTGNVVIDDNTSYAQENRFFEISTYKSDIIYAQTITPTIAFFFSKNCYYNPNVATSFGVYESNNGDLTCSGRGNNGSAVNFSNWKATYGFDTSGSYEENPSLDSYHRATSTNCADKGWLTIQESL